MTGIKKEFQFNNKCKGPNESEVMRLLFINEKFLTTTNRIQKLIFKKTYWQQNTGINF